MWRRSSLSLDGGEMHRASCFVFFEVGCGGTDVVVSPANRVIGRIPLSCISSFL